MAKNLTIVALVRASGVSRTTLLHYERVGLLRPAARTTAGYRLYGPAELERLRRIRALRAAGLGLLDIRRFLADTGPGAAAILRKRFDAIAEEIEELRGQQGAILRLLGNLPTGRKRSDAMTKQKWIEIMDAAGLTDDAKHRWHRAFEANDPDEHELFLRYLQIPDDEIRQIRAASRKA